MDSEDKQESITIDKKRGRPQQSISLGTIYNEAKLLNTEQRKIVFKFIRDTLECAQDNIVAINNIENKSNDSSSSAEFI